MKPRGKRRPHKAPATAGHVHSPNVIADLNRVTLGEAGILAISVMGGPGCGKTALIDAAIQRLTPKLHVGVIACNIPSRFHADGIVCHSAQVIQVNVNEVADLDATDIRDALGRLDLQWVDVLFIETMGTLLGAPPNLGQGATVVVFSVAAGHDKAARHPELVTAADVVVLNKTDLLSMVPFHLPSFHREVQRLNASARTFELSALAGSGVEAWTNWVSDPRIPPPAGA